MSEIINRPWGTYETILEGDNYKVKRIIVKPHSQLSLQSHKHRSEHWVVVGGNGVVSLNDSKIEVKKDDCVYIKIGDKHRMSNNSNEDVVFIEVQNGDYLGEDDIIRYEDDYGRK